MTITAKDVRNAILKTGMTEWMVRTCSICDHPLLYRFQADRVFFDSNCNCTGYWTPPQERTYENVADTFELNPSRWEEFLAGSRQTASDRRTEGVSGEQPLPDPHDGMALQPTFTIR